VLVRSQLHFVIKHFAFKHVVVFDIDNLVRQWWQSSFYFMRLRPDFGLDLNLGMEVLVCVRKLKSVDPVALESFVGHVV
jgi:hypothetical protein